MKRPRLSSDSQISRRGLSARVLAYWAPRAIVFLLLACAVFQSTALTSLAIAPPLSAQYSLSGADEIFLEDMERREFRYFWEQADPHTGLIADRAPTDN